MLLGYNFTSGGEWGGGGVGRTEKYTPMHVLTENNYLRFIFYFATSCWAIP